MTLAFSCAPDVLRRLVERMGKVVDRRSKAPILQNLLLADDGEGRLTVTGTDIDITAVAISAPGEVEIESRGATTVPAEILRTYLKKLGKAPELRFASDGKQAIIRAGGSTFRPFELPADDFPATKTVEDATRLSLTAPQLRRIATACGFAMSTEETRYYLCGVFLHVAPDAPGQLTAVASDGHRLARLHLEIEGDVTAMPSVILSRKVVEMFDTIAEAAGDGPINLEISAERVGFEAGELRIVSRVIDGTYPDYARVIPADQPIRADVERKTLTEAIARVAAVRSERGSAVKFKFAEAGLALSMTTQDANAGHDEIEIEGGDDLSIGFNATYSLAALESFDTHRIEIGLSDPGSPALLTAPGDASRLVVLMPMRV